MEVILHVILMTEMLQFLVFLQHERLKLNNIYTTMVRVRGIILLICKESTHPNVYVTCKSFTCIHIKQHITGFLETPLPFTTITYNKSLSMLATLTAYMSLFETSTLDESQKYCQYIMSMWMLCYKITTFWGVIARAMVPSSTVLMWKAAKLFWTIQDCSFSHLQGLFK
jgi:hypothetical protein